MDAIREQPGAQPSDMTIDRPAEVMRVVWTDGHQSRLPLSLLRARCPCAECRELRRNTDPLRVLKAMPSAVVRGAELMGNYALKITWADGHSAGLYTFGYLRALCPCGQCQSEIVTP